MFVKVGEIIFFRLLSLRKRKIGNTLLDYGLDTFLIAAIRAFYKK